MAKTLTESNEPIRLLSSQVDQASEVLAKAFQDDPAYTQLFPNLDERLHSLRRLWGGVLKHCLVYGEVHTTSLVNSAAGWLSPGNVEVTFWQMLRTGFALQRAVMRFEKNARDRFLEVLDYLDGVHKDVIKRPHWYLWVLGVDPSFQGQGIGGKLIEPVLARSDDEGVPCYLEAMTERNVAFYKKREFEVVSEGEVLGQEVKVWMMLREPGQSL